MPMWIKLDKSEKDIFYSLKYNDYKKFNAISLIVSTFAYIILFFKDIDFYENDGHGYLLIRMSVLMFLAFFLLAYYKKWNYKIMTMISYIYVLYMMINIVWVTSSLQNEPSINENLAFLGLILLVVSFSTPLIYSLIAQWLIVWLIIILNEFLHFNDFKGMIVYNCQVAIILNTVSILVARMYYFHYIDRQKLLHLSVHDPLTNLHNRNYLDQFIFSSQNVLNAYKDISVIIMDLDYFKKVNDTYGHQQGDVLLKFVADQILNTFRTSDIIIRWGGEEFLVILLNCQENKAYDLAETLRKKIESSDNGVCKTTISIGIANCKTTNIQDAIKEADQALYTAKSNGRNQVAIYKKS